MALSLWDHHRRLEDLELAVGMLRELLPADTDGGQALQNAAHKLKTRGAEGAAQLLIGERVAAAYRR